MICKIAFRKQCNDADNNLKQACERTAGRRKSEFKRPQQEMPCDRIRLDRQRHVLLLSSQNRNLRRHISYALENPPCVKGRAGIWSSHKAKPALSGGDDSDLRSYS